MHPFIPAENLLQQTGKDTHNLKQVLERTLHHHKFSLVVFGFVCVFKSSVVIKQDGFKKQGHLVITMGFLGGSVVKNLPANAEDTGSIPMSGRSPGEENGNPLHYSCLGNPVDRGAWGPTVHGVTKEL